MTIPLDININKQWSKTKNHEILPKIRDKCVSPVKRVPPEDPLNLKALWRKAKAVWALRCPGEAREARIRGMVSGQWGPVGGGTNTKLVIFSCKQFINGNNMVITMVILLCLRIWLQYIYYIWDISLRDYIYIYIDYYMYIHSIPIIPIIVV